MQQRLSYRQYNAAYILKGNHGTLTEEELANYDQRPFVGLAKRHLLVKSGKRVAWTKDLQDAIAAYESTDISRKTKGLPIANYFIQSFRLHVVNRRGYHRTKAAA